MPSSSLFSQVLSALKSPQELDWLLLSSSVESSVILEKMTANTNTKRCQEMTKITVNTGDTPLLERPSLQLQEKTDAALDACLDCRFYFIVVSVLRSVWLSLQTTSKDREVEFDVRTLPFAYIILYSLSLSLNGKED